MENKMYFMVRGELVHREMINQSSSQPQIPAITISDELNYITRGYKNKLIKSQWQSFAFDI